MNTSIAGYAMTFGVWEKFRRKHIYRYRNERIAAELYRDGFLFDDQKLTCGDRRLFFAAAVVIKGEAPFIEEWVEFHRMMGVEHFIVYDNGLDRETQEILQPYVESRELTRIAWPTIGRPGMRTRYGSNDDLRLQDLAFGHCVRRFQGQVDWLFKCDADEFVYPVREENASVAEVLRGLDEDQWLGMRIPMWQFGSSGHIDQPNGLVIEQYTRSEKAISRGCKSIGNAKMLAMDYCSGPHHFRYRFGPWMRGKLTGRPREMHRRQAQELLHINHYRTKSREDYLRKGEINRGGWMGGKESIERFEMINETHNEIENLNIKRFVEPLKRAMASRDVALNL